MRWIFDHLLWDTAGTAREGFWKWVWAARKVFGALAGSALLDRLEWIEHHPPQMVVVALIHFVLVLAAIALFVPIGQWFRGADNSSPSR